MTITRDQLPGPLETKRFKTCPKCNNTGVRLNPAGMIVTWRCACVIGKTLTTKEFNQEASRLMRTSKSGVTQGSDDKKYHGHPKFYELLQQMADLHSRKNHDYAGDDPLSNLRSPEDIGVPAWKGVLVRLMDKWSRLKTFAKTGNFEVKDEGVRDTLMDNAVYSLLCIILLEEDKGTLPLPAEAATDVPNDAQGEEEPGCSIGFCSSCEQNKTVPNNESCHGEIEAFAKYKKETKEKVRLTSGTMRMGTPCVVPPCIGCHFNSYEHRSGCLIPKYSVIPNPCPHRTAMDAADYAHGES